MGLFSLGSLEDARNSGTAILRKICQNDPPHPSLTQPNFYNGITSTGMVISSPSLVSLETLWGS